MQVNGSGKQGPHPLKVPPVEEGLINSKLPTELMLMAFAYLDQASLQSTVRVCNRWKMETLVLARLQNSSWVSSLTSLLGQPETAGKYGALIQQIDTILTRSNIRQCAGLKFVKLVAQQLRKDITGVLRSLPDTELESLRLLTDTPQTVVLSHLFASVILSKKYDAAHELYDAEQKTNELIKICVDFANIGEPDEAIRVAKSVPHGLELLQVLFPITTALLKSNRIDRALLLTCSIPHTSTKSYILRNISMALLNNKQYDRAQRLSFTIPEKHIQNMAIHEICIALLNKKKINRALSFAYTIPDDKLRCQVLYDISMVLIRSNPLDEQPSEHETKDVYCENFELLIISGQVLQAFTLAFTLSDHKQKCRVMRIIANAFLRIKFDEVLAMANDDTKTDKLNDITNDLLDLGDLDEVERVAMAMSNDLQKSNFLSRIVKERNKRGQIDKALQVAYTIPLDDTKSLALQDICKALVKDYQIDRAMKVADTCPKGEIADAILKDIHMALFNRYSSWVLSLKQLLEQSETDTQKLTTVIQQIEETINEIKNRNWSSPKVSALQLSLYIKIALRPLRVSELENLRQVTNNSPADFFSHLFASAILNKRYTTVLEMADPVQKCRELRDISMGFLNLEDHFYEAVRAARAIPDNEERNTVLYEMFKELLKRKQMDLAQLVIHYMPNIEVKIQAIREISMTLIDDSPQVNEIVKLANTLPNDEFKSRALREMITSLIRNNQLYSARKVAYLIPDDSYKNKALHDVAMALVKSTRIELAMHVATTRPNPGDSTMDDVFSAIFEPLIASGDSMRALWYARSIKEDRTMCQALRIIARILIPKNNDEALKVIELINIEYYKDQVLQEIAMSAPTTLRDAPPA